MVFLEIVIFDGNLWQHKKCVCMHVQVGEVNHHKGIDGVMKIFRISYKRETSRRKIAFHAFRKRIILLNALSASKVNNSSVFWILNGGGRRA